MTQNFKLKAVSAAVLASCISMQMQVSAAETNKSEEEETTIEVIEVTGFKGSVMKAMNSKRFSDSVSDSIHAEDVGKSTDQNIADALSRVTGVTVQEDAGEGTRISVRGAGANLNQISINGVALTSGLGGSGENPIAEQSVDLSAFSSNILSSIDVVKTSSADQDEGSLGATVILRTVKPLSLAHPRRSVNVEGRYNEFSGEFDNAITASFADKFLDDTLGFAITINNDQQKTRQDTLNNDWENETVSFQDLDSSSGFKGHDLATGKYLRVLGWQRDANGNRVVDDDGQYISNSVDSLTTPYDPETELLINGDLDVLARQWSQLAIATDKRERTSVSAGLEWAPLDSTNIQLDVTHTQQTNTTDYHNVRLNFAPLNKGANSEDPIADWNGIDLTTNTLERHYSRNGAGTLNRSQGDTEVETNIVSLTLEHYITDNLSVDLLLGYSKTTDKTDNFVSLTTSTWGTTTQGIVDAMPLDMIEPIGIDCSGASNTDCLYALGTTAAQIDPHDGSVTSVTSSFNPNDLLANHLSALTFRNNDQTDTNKSAMLNFKWEFEALDFFTGVDFGYKYAEREKDVFTQNQQANTGSALIDKSNPDISYNTVGMASITLIDMMSGDAFPYDNFAEDLVDDRSAPVFQGWPMLDAQKALQAFSGKDPSTVGVSTNSGDTRNINVETNAAYVKLKFEQFDGKLTGNVGVRYVKDKNTAEGTGNIRYYRHPHMLDPHNLLIERRLGDIEGSPQCPQPIAGINPDNGTTDSRWAPLNEDQLSNCWDWGLTHGFNYDNAETLPYDRDSATWLIPGGQDTNRLVFIDYSGATPVYDENSFITLPNQVVDINGDLVSSPRSTHRQFAAKGYTWPYLDRTTSFVGPNGDQPNSDYREAPASGNSDNDIFLPSLNINYAFNDELIGRFAVSKTMSRVRFDSLNPKLQINENVWQNTASGEAGNVNLKPLTSNNLDISLEWYFNETGMLSAAVFTKDMKNFEENVITPYHYKDVRTEYDLENVNILLEYDENRVPGDAEKCQPRRFVGGFSASDWGVYCHQVDVDLVVNGNGSEMKGIELGYVQTYDFLPGLLSNLGASINYTYQDSESESQEIGTSGRYLKPLPQAFTPKHSANTALFWENDGISLRLAHRYNSEQLTDRGQIGGAIWQESTSRLDFSSSYEINKNLSVTFNAINLTDDTRRTYYTSSNTRNAAGELVMDEGNVLDSSDITDSRTQAMYKTGRQYRVGIRANF